MDLLNQVANAAEGVTGVKVDEGEDMKQTMKEHAMEEVMEDKLKKVAGEKVQLQRCTSMLYSHVVTSSNCSSYVQNMRHSICKQKAVFLNSRGAQCSYIAKIKLCSTRNTSGGRLHSASDRVSRMNHV